MKKLTIILCFVTFGSYAQILIPTQDTTAFWSIWSEIHMFMGDSTFSGNLYKKTYVHYGSNINYDSLHYIGLFRQESSGQKAYAVAKDSLKEKMLFDISANVGDTVKFYPGFISESFLLGFFPLIYPDGIITTQIKSVDTILYNGIYRKRLELTPYNSTVNESEYWIEGVGSTAGILNSGLRAVPYSPIYPEVLMCLEVNGMKAYQAPEPYNIGCYFTKNLGIDEKSKKGLVYLYPNPTKEYITIQFPTYSTKGVLRLYNINGELLLNVALLENKNLVNLPNLTSGTYVAEIESEGTFYKKTIVVLE